MRRLVVFSCRRRSQLRRSAFGVAPGAGIACCGASRSVASRRVCVAYDCSIACRCRIARLVSACALDGADKVANGLVVNGAAFDARSDQVFAAPGIQRISYDAAGRTTEIVGGADCSVCMQGDGAGIARTYDAQNHLLSEPLLQQNPDGGELVLPTTDMTLGWGLDGHPATMSQRTGAGSIDNEALHWDGRAVLYTVGSNSSDPSNLTIALYISTLGVVDLQRFSGGKVQAFEITTLDRDGSGQALQRHAADWFSRFDGQGSAWRTPLEKIRGSGSCAPFPAASGCPLTPPWGHRAQSDGAISGGLVADRRDGAHRWIPDGGRDDSGRTRLRSQHRAMGEPRRLRRYHDRSRLAETVHVERQ